MNISSNYFSVDYIFELKDSKYTLSKEILRYNGDSGSITVKEMTFNVDWDVSNLTAIIMQ